MPAPATQTNVLDLAAERAVRVARAVSRFGNLGNAIAMARHEDDFDLMGELLQHERAQLEAADPSLKIARLHREAASLDARADDCIREGAAFAGQAAMRRQRFGDDEGFAEILQHKAEARDRLAIKYGDQAFALKLEAAGIIAQEDLKACLTGAIRSIGGVR